MARAATELETDRLRFRLFREDDFPTYETWCANIEIMRYLGGKTFDEVQAARHMAYLAGHWTLYGYGYYVCEEKASGKMIGRVGFTNHPGWPGFELGWVLGRPWWGRGYAVEAAIRCRDYAFDEMGRDRLISLIRPDNVRSVNVAVKIGETLAGEVELLGSKALVYEIRKR